MPILNGQGQSQATFDKQDGLRLILKQHIATCSKIFTKSDWLDPKRYHYIDLNAGCGYNEEIGCDGSPVVFSETIKLSRLDYAAHFIDVSPRNTMLLRQYITPNGCTQIHTGDHATIAPDIIKGWPQTYAYGLIYTDPNGVPPFDLLAELSKNPKLQRVDLLIRYTGAGVKRAGYKLLDELSKIQKQYWIVRDLDRHDRWQWTFLLGLNWGGLKAMERQGFHYAKDEQGLSIIERLHFTNQEREARQQPTLPYATYEEYLEHPQWKAVRQQAIDRSGGICEICHWNPVTEVHHIQYPPWGTFEENAEHLLAICHACHCRLHNKDR